MQVIKIVIGLPCLHFCSHQVLVTTGYHYVLSMEGIVQVWAYAWILFYFLATCQDTQLHMTVCI